MKNLKLLPVNEIGIYLDSNRELYESRILGLIIIQDSEEEDGIIGIRPISEMDLQEGYIDLNINDEFLHLKK